ncbi:hypothetical protein QYF36_023483 [Acer negundo]|nr:hypothetical protein QYF36_023483 [Acer negundo]
MIPRNYLLGGALMVRCREVRINPADINRYFRAAIPEEERGNIYKGLVKNDIFTKMNVELANALVPPEKAMLFWNTRPCSHRSTVAYEVVQLLYCLQQGSRSILGCSKRWKSTSIDLSAEEIKELPIDIRINQWYSFYPSRGLRRPRGPKRTRIEAEDSESDAEGSEPKAGDVEDVKDVEEDDNVEDGLMQDFTELRIELKVFPYSRPKKAHPFPLSHIPPIGGPAISEEAAQINIATERSLKELADREAAVRDPSSKGKGKLPRTS